MLKTIFLVFLVYLLYKLVFGFIIPVYRASSQVRSRIREVQRQMEEQQRRQQAGQPPYSGPAQNQARPSGTQPAADKGDYIDFEEIKDGSAS